MRRNPAAERRGASMIEYAFLILLIALAVFAGIATFGGQLREKYGEISGMFP